MSAKPIDYLKAVAYTKWVQSIIGEQPAIVRRDDGTIYINFTEPQQQKMRAWLDKQLFNTIANNDQSEKPTIEYGIGGIVLPWSMRYVLPASIAIFLFGKFLGR